ncbi:MAG: phytanoyl-CoA dioxygenase family protein [Alphaproteobacteria bacterium]|nr:phytanoyl-CoA dioxygenase family protein [Alphaproteobacteria bacterium]
MPDSTLPSTLAKNISDKDIAAYNRDGAMVLREVIPAGWIALMRDAIQTILDHPGDAAIEYTPEGETGRYYGDFFVWRRNDDFRAFMQDSPLVEVAAQVMAAQEVRFFYDQLLVKEPGTKEETPWHQDLPYWPLRGDQIISIWVPFDSASAESGVVHYLKGSHKWGKMFAPKSFASDSGFGDIYAKAGFEALPDNLVHDHKHDVIHWDVEPGDVIIHHPLTLHFAPGNASQTGRRRGLALRYVGNDAVFDDRPGTFIDNPRLKATLPKISLKDGEPLSGDLFPKVWPRA